MKVLYRFWHIYFFYLYNFIIFVYLYHVHIIFHVMLYFLLCFNYFFMLGNYIVFNINKKKLRIKFWHILYNCWNLRSSKLAVEVLLSNWLGLNLSFLTHSINMQKLLKAKLHHHHLNKPNLFPPPRAFWPIQQNIMSILLFII